MHVVGQFLPDMITDWLKNTNTKKMKRKIDPKIQQQQQQSSINQSIKQSTG